MYDGANTLAKQQKISNESNQSSSSFLKILKINIMQDSKPTNNNPSNKCLVDPTLQQITGKQTFIN